VNFFALTGPTGSGKSTLIDGLCFALYGTVPRWGKENVIAHALAPAASACRVGLVFEAGGKRYAAVRALARDKRGQVHTREARLDLLDPAVAPDAPLADLLGAAIEHLAEGPDPVKARVEDILGLTYDHFTSRCCCRRAGSPTSSKRSRASARSCSSSCSRSVSTRRSGSRPGKGPG
jgi:exonuclease SbcC